MERLKSASRTPHFWILVIITLCLILVYLAWPWPEYKFSEGALHWVSWLSTLDFLAIFELRIRLFGSLFLIPIIYASIIFGWRGSLIVLISALVGMSPVFKDMWISSPFLFTNTAFLIVPTVVIIAANIELKLRDNDKRVFIEREKEREMYMAKILETQEKERQRLAEELHDESVQALVAVASYAEFIESDDVQDIQEMKEKASWIKTTTRDTVQDLRRISVDLRPGVLDNLGLASALQWLVERTNTQHSVAIQLVTSGLEEIDIDPSTEVAVFRIVQEALQNIVRHSKASEAIIGLRAETDCLSLTVQDNGRGFVPPTRYTDFVTQDKLGLVGMHERARSLGGILEIRSAPGEGTLLFLEIPLP